MPETPEDYIEIAKAVSSKITGDKNTMFSMLVGFGGIFMVSGYIYKGKKYGLFEIKAININDNAIVRLNAGLYDFIK